MGKRFGDRTVLEGIDLAVEAGEVVGLIGPNGGGKSTLLSIFAGLVQPTEGSVQVAGHPAHTLARNASGTVGLITPEPGLYPSLTVRENLEWFAGLYRRSAQRMQDWAEPLDLADALDRRAGDLSSGQRQKASLVRALLLEPQVLLFDEPTANLDPLASEHIHGQIRARADDGIAVVLCTHDLVAAEQICDRVAVLNRTLRAVEVLEGPRSPPSTGRLHAAFAEAT